MGAFSANAIEIDVEDATADHRVDARCQLVQNIDVVDHHRAFAPIERPEVDRPVGIGLTEEWAAVTVPMPARGLGQDDVGAELRQHEARHVSAVIGQVEDPVVAEHGHRLVPWIDRDSAY